MFISLSKNCFCGEFCYYSPFLFFLQRTLDLDIALKIQHDNCSLRRASIMYWCRIWNFPRLLLMIAALPGSRSKTAQTKCYRPNGSINPRDRPCNPNSNPSFCCGPGYACLDNHLCKSTNFADQPDLGFIRGTCTDSTWTSDACPKFCIAATSMILNRFTPWPLDLADSLLP